MAAAFDTYLKWPTRRKAIVWLLFTAAVVLLYYFLLFQPRLEELRGLEADYDRLVKELRENQAIAAEPSQSEGGSAAPRRKARPGPAEAAQS